MKAADQIDVGDKVIVVLAVNPMTGVPTGYYADAEVLYLPAATGDAWHIRDTAGDLHYIQTYVEAVRRICCNLMSTNFFYPST